MVIYLGINKNKIIISQLKLAKMKTKIDREKLTATTNIAAMTKLREGLEALIGSWLDEGFHPDYDIKPFLKEMTDQIITDSGCYDE